MKTPYWVIFHCIDSLASLAFTFKNKNFASRLNCNIPSGSLQTNPGSVFRDGFQPIFLTQWWQDCAGRSCHCLFLGHHALRKANTKIAFSFCFYVLGRGGYLEIEIAKLDREKKELEAENEKLEQKVTYAD